MMKERSKLISFVFLGFVVLNLYLIGVFVFYLVLKFNFYKNHIGKLRDYLSKDRKNIERVVTKVFDEAIVCKSEDCQNKISSELANILNEDYYAKDPAGLFFVKKYQKKYYLLRWDGKAVDITNKVRKINLKTQSSFFDILAADFKYSPKECVYFGKLVNSNTCEYYLKIEIPKEEAYIGDIMVFTDLVSLTYSELVLTLPIYITLSSLRVLLPQSF